MFNNLWFYNKQKWRENMNLDSGDDDLGDIEFMFECNFKLSPNPENAVYKMAYWAYWTVLGLLLVGAFLTIVSISLGITSWILIEKWRKFRNYIFLNGIALAALVSIATYIGENIKCLDHYPFFMNDKRFVIAQVVRVLLRISISHWLLAAAVVFCTDIVKVGVFKIRITRRYLVTNLFVWVTPIVEGTILFSTVYYCKYKIRQVEHITICIICLFLLASVIMYLKGLLTLFWILGSHKSDARRQICVNITLSLAAFVPVLISSYLPMTIIGLFTRSLLIKTVVYLVCIVNMIGGISVFLSLRSHREAWREYLHRRKMQHRQFGNT